MRCWNENDAAMARTRQGWCFDDTARRTGTGIIEAFNICRPLLRARATFRAHSVTNGFVVLTGAKSDSSNMVVLVILMTIVIDMRV
jgi:hypothetical protein